MLILFSPNSYGEEKRQTEWSEKGDIWRAIPNTQWNFKIDNQQRDSNLYLQIIEDNDINSEKAPVVELNAPGKENRTLLGKIINLPALYILRVKKGNCNWEFSPGSLLSTQPPESVFLSIDPHNSKCDQAIGEIAIEFDKKTNKGDFLFILKDVRDIPKPIP